MKNKYLLSLLWVIVSGFGVLMAQEIAIIPQPAHLIVKNESFKFGKQLKVCIASYRGDSVTLVFDSFKDDFQKATGIKVTSVRSEAKAGIVLSVNQTLAPEAYKLDVSPKQIRIEAARPAGFYYALQTLKQLISRHVMAGVAVGGRQEWSIPTVEIEDVPRFEWRGFMLDEGRHFFGKDEVKRVIDIMSTYKMNRFHWHLTEDQGWRIEIKKYPKDQYQVMLEVSQNIWDGGDIRSKKQLTQATSEIDRGKLEVDMYALNDRVNQLYFGILLLDEQLKQNQLLQEDLRRTHQLVSNYMANGIANQSDLDAVSVEILNTKQKRIELESSRQAYLSMLSIFTGKEIASETTLEKPADTFESISLVNNRPELRWFDAQGRQLNVQESSLKTRFRPRFGLFVQGAYGNPGLNMLKDDFSAFYVAGVRMSWNFGSLYTLRNDRRLIDNNRRKLETSRDVFLFNANLQSTQQSSAIQSMRRQMVDDDEIIRLRVNIRKAAEAKVENGTLTVTDMLREITAENLARQTKALHEVQLLMNIWNLKYTLNN